VTVYCRCSCSYQADQELHAFINTNIKIKATPRLPGRQEALLSQAWRGEYCLSANSTSNLILQRFPQRRKQQDVRRMQSAHASICIFIMATVFRISVINYLSQAVNCLSFKNITTYFPWYIFPILLWEEHHLFFPPHQAFPSLTAQHPGIMSWNDGLHEAAREITSCSLSPAYTQKSARVSTECSHMPGPC
jgi:hypothetical protein